VVAFSFQDGVLAEWRRVLSMSKVPKFFIVAVVIKAIVLIWMGYHGFPRATGDIILFKQPAYTYLHTGSFSIAKSPERPLQATVTFYPPLYTYANLLAFKALGFSLYTSLAFDMSIHLILSTIIAYVLLRITNNQLVAIFHLFLSTFLLLPIGRPEEMGALFIITALVLHCTSHRRYLVSALLLGLSVVTAPTQGVVGIILFLAYDAISSGLSRKFFLNLLGLGTASILVVVLIWALILSSQFALSVNKFIKTISSRYKPDLLKSIVSHPDWGVFFFFSALLVFGIGAFLIVSHRSSDHLRAQERALLTAIVLSLPLCIGVHVFLQRPYYDYRLLGYVYLATALYISHILVASGKGAGNLSRRKSVAFITFPWIILVSGLANYDIVRYVLVPFTWDVRSVTYSDAVQIVRTLVPADATVGGDAALWWTIADGRPYYSLFWLGQGQWPEYVLSTTFWGGGGKATILLEEEWAARIDASYQELTVSTAVQECAIDLPILGVRVPISRSNCDWNVRVWRRR